MATVTAPGISQAEAAEVAAGSGVAGSGVAGSGAPAGDPHPGPPEDRLIRLNKRRARKAEGGDAPKETRKPHSGRPVSDRALHAALTGGTLSGPTKTRILKAVNHLLEQKKQDKVDLKTLF